ncbi:hypothetical protein D3C73_850650 [compost metagenome]
MAGTAMVGPMVGSAMAGAAMAGIPAGRVPDRTISSKATDNQEFQPGSLNVSPSYAQQSNVNSPQQINVSVAKDAVNLTVNKDEINYDLLAELAGRKIASQVRFAMQNVK